PNHVAIVELDERDALDTSQNLDRIEQTGAAPGWQIDLRQVAGHHHLGVESLARQHHLHLFGGAVLGLIENDEAVVQSPAAHECQRRYFNRRALEQFLHFVGFEHVVKSVVKRTQIRIDFFLQAARQKSEFLTRFHRRPRENNSRHTLADQRLDRHCYGQISFAGAGGADSKHQIGPLDSFEIPALRDGLRGQDLFAKAPLLPAFEERAKRNFRIGRDHAKKAVQITVLENHALTDKREIVLQNPFGPGYRVRIAFDFDIVVAESRPDIQAGLEQSHILITCTKKAFDAAAYRNCGC